MRLLLFLLVLIPVQLFAQTGRLTARLTASGSGIDKATIHLIQQDQIVFSTKSNQAGNFSFVGIPESVYILSITKPGFNGFRKKITISQSSTVRLEIELSREKRRTSPSDSPVVAGSKRGNKPVSPADGAPPTDATSQVDSVAMVQVMEEIQPVPDFVEFPEEPAEPDGGLAAIIRNIEYPKVALSLGLEGRVLLSVIVGKEGEPLQVAILKSAGGFLDQAAIDAVYKSQFKPGRHFNQPVISRVTIPIPFRMN